MDPKEICATIDHILQMDSINSATSSSTASSSNIDRRVPLEDIDTKNSNSSETNTVPGSTTQNAVKDQLDNPICIRAAEEAKVEAESAIVAKVDKARKVEKVEEEKKESDKGTAKGGKETAKDKARKEENMLGEKKEQHAKGKAVNKKEAEKKEAEKEDKTRKVEKVAETTDIKKGKPGDKEKAEGEKRQIKIRPVK